jgi:hypothetical protein
MRLQQNHPIEGPGLVSVRSPDLAVHIVIDPRATHRSVDILADRGLAAFCGTGKRGDVIPGVHQRDENGEPIPGTVVHDVEMRIEVGRPGMVDFLRNTLGLRQGSSVTSGGSGSVRASGRGSVAVGGDISGCSIGEGSRNSLSKRIVVSKTVGVKLTIPIGCSIKIKSAPVVLVISDGQVCTLESAHRNGLLKKV